MKKTIFLATAFAAGLFTIGYAQYSATQDSKATAENTVLKAANFNSYLVQDTVPKKDTVPPTDTTSTKP